MRKVNKAWDTIICLGINMFILVLWGYEMLIASDIPVEVPFNEVMVISLLLILFLILYSIYARNTKYLLINSLLLLLPLLLWFISMQQALTYNYHKNDTLISIIGFTITMIAFMQIIYKKIRNRN